MSVIAEEVRHYKASEAPLVTKDGLHQRFGFTHPDISDVGPGSHSSVNIDCFRGNFKWLEVDLAHTLLRSPCTYHLAVAVIHGIMLDGRINAFLQSPLHSICCHKAGQHTVFGEVLIVTGCESGAVGIHSRCIPAGGTQFLGHFTHQFTPLLCKLMAPGAGDNHFNRIADRTAAGEVVIYGCRSVRVDILNFADGRNRRGLVTGESNHIRHLIYFQFIQKLVPHRVIIRLAAQIGKLDSVFRTERRHGVIRVDVGIRVIVGIEMIAFNVLLRHIKIDRCGGCSFVIGKAVLAG